MASFISLPPKATLHAAPFNVSFPDATVEEMKLLIKASKLAPETYESSLSDRKYGVTREWMINAKHQWENNFNWYVLLNRPLFLSDIRAGAKLRITSIRIRIIPHRSWTMMAKRIQSTLLLSSLRNQMRFH